MNKYQAILKLFPNARPDIDFYVMDDGSGEKMVWNLPNPQPTETELQAAWEQVKNLPKEPTQEDRISALESALLSKMGL